MIDHIEIRNFLAFSELKETPLKQINLVAGRNGAGKTALLEALRIVTAEKKQLVINNILENRKLLRSNDNTVYSYLFNHQGSSETTDNETLRINDVIIRREKKKGSVFTNYFIEYGNNIKEELTPHPSGPKFDTAIYIPSISDFSVLSRLWSEITLTPREDDVIAILRQAIDSRIVRFNITENSVKVRLGGLEQPVELATLGDGVQRILLIALSLANAKDGIILIDEIETHLHYSVLKELWGIIFDYAIKWNIQIVATTHSDDAIRQMYYATEKNPNYGEIAQFIRLQKNRKGNAEAVLYGTNQLEDMLKLELEIR